MPLFFTTCECPCRQSGKHIPGCPMNSNCSFCGLSPLMCRMMNKCGGIRKTAKFFAAAHENCKTIKMKLSKKKEDLSIMLNRLINHGAVSDVLEEKIDALKKAFDAIISRSPLIPSIIEDAQSILMKLQRIHDTQKAAHEKRLKEEDEAALAECAAEDFMPGRSND